MHSKRVFQVALGLVLVSAIGCGSRRVSIDNRNQFGTLTQPKAVSVKLTANGSEDSISVAAGASVRFEWKSANATECTLSVNGVQSGVAALQGTRDIVVSDSAAYVATCSGEGGTAVSVVDVSIGSVAGAPTMTLTGTDALGVERSGVLVSSHGANTILRWTSQSATDCILISPSGNLAAATLSNTVGFPVGPILSTQVWALKCGNDNGETTKSLVISHIPPAPIVSLFSLNGMENPFSVVPGSVVAVRWQTDWASECVLYGLQQSFSSDRSNTLGLPLPPATANETLTLSCIGPGGRTDLQRSFSVVAAPSTTAILKVNGSTAAATVAHGSTVNVEWASTGATSCLVKRGTATIEDRYLNSPAAVPVGPLTETQAIFSLNCSGAGGAAGGSITITVSAPPDHLFFISSAKYSGNLGGLAGGDAKCATLANAAGLRPGSAWKALLSTSASPVNNRIVINGQVKDVTGRVLSSGTAFWGNMAVAPNLDEYGTAVGGSGYGYPYDGGNVWTGSDSAGNVGRTNCSDWTSVTGNGVAGYSLLNTTWLHRLWPVAKTSINYMPCNYLVRIYCISQNP